MNPHNYKFGQIKFYKWISGLKIETIEEFVNDDLLDLFHFLCKDYAVQLQKEDYESELAKFRVKIQKAQNFSFEQKKGVLLVRYDDDNDGIEIWCANVDGPAVFINYCGIVSFCYNDIQLDIDNDDIDLDQHSSHPFDDIVSKLKTQNFQILGVKLSAACTEHDDIYKKMVELCTHHHIILIANMSVK
eukprot:328540_1